MSKQNKVNKTNYTQRGRLTPDDMARERVKQEQATGRAKEKEEKAGERAPSRPRSAPEERD